MATYRQQSTPVFARMEQPRNYGTDTIERAVYILAMRAVRAGLLTASQIAGMLQTQGYSEVPQRTVRYWVEHQPDLPEQVVEMGLARPEHFPTWTRRFLRTQDGTVPMAQESPLGAFYGPKNEEPSVAKAVAVGFFAWLGYQVAKSIVRGTGSPSRS